MKTGSVVAITGASGLLGSHLCRVFAEQGWIVRAGVRSPGQYAAPASGVVPFQCLLPDGIDETGVRGAEVCIHAAYTTRHTSMAEARRVNEDGTSAVLELSRRLDVRQFVFISSCAAHPHARSYYGRSKFQLEQRLDPARDLIFRPGLLIARGGLFARLAGWVERRPFVPVFSGGTQKIQTVHIHDCGQAILRAIELGKMGAFVLAGHEETTLKEILSALAEKLGKHPLFVSVPAGPVLAVLRLAEALRLQLPVSSENVLGLTTMVHQDPARAVAELGVRMRPFREAIDALFAEQAR